MNIEPHYVDFNTAKLLKEKGFDLPVSVVYKNKDGWEEVIGVPYNYNYFENIQSAPEQWQVVEWLRVNHSIWVQPSFSRRQDYTIRWEYNIYDLKVKNKMWCDVGYDSPQKAYAAAFDYILTKLI